MNAALQLDEPVSAVSGVGTKYANLLEKAFGITTVRHLVEHYPRRLSDLGELTDLGEVVTGVAATLVGTIVHWDQRRPRSSKRGRSLKITEARVQAAGGGQFRVTFFNQPWIAEKYKVGVTAAFSGKVEHAYGSYAIKTPDITPISGPDVIDELTGPRLQPVYPATDALPSWRLANWITAALDDLPPFEDYLSESMIDERDLVALDDAMRWIHAPADEPSYFAARSRLIFDELFTLALGLQWRRSHLEAQVAGLDNHPEPAGIANQFLMALPFQPTGAQERAMDEIGRDLAADRPMHRLLQGDVGAGKTMVATWTMLCAVGQRRQAALMAPTEVLAEQHLRTLTEQLAPLGVNVLDGVRVELLTSSTPMKARRRILGELLTGDVDIVVGTHALLEEGVRFADLGVVVIDEQHRFGVSQRVTLKDKGAEASDGRTTLPDVLVMTATPIPRSLALTLYGDLDVSVLDELPPGRKPIVTQLIIPKDSPRRARLYDFVRDQAAEGFQTYIVCPLVEPSTEIEATSAVERFEELRDGPLSDLGVVLVHGQMSSSDKEAAMTDFRTGAASVMVATTVIEVGVDVPSATIMIIEDAERFGISQLHQLRGRVGRGGDASYCVLFADPPTDEARGRLEAVAATTDGFALAETDLEIRGEGQLFGQRQSGLPDLKIARLRRDLNVIATTRGLAQDIITIDPDLTGHAALRAEVLRRYEGGLDEFEALHTG